MRIRLSDRYTLDTKKSHPLIRALGALLISLAAIALVGMMLFFSWYAYALVTL